MIKIVSTRAKSLPLLRINQLECEAVSPFADSRRGSARASKLYQTLENPVLVQALAHPLRAKILYVLEEREASPKELAAHFKTPLANVAYHIQVLRKLKLIRLVRKTPRRGAVEHHYTADHAAHVDDQSWSQTPGLIKERMVAALLEEIGGNATDAAATGGFDQGNAHLSRSRLVLDHQAWDALSAKLSELLDWGYELEKESAKRLKRSNHENERRTGFVMMLFESMPAVTPPDAERSTGLQSAGRSSRAGAPT
jgi:DNA-binding transcriptional ArsR family regulator